MPPCSATRGRVALADGKGSHHHWVFARPLTAGRAQPPLVKDRHLVHKIAPVRAEVQQGPSLLDAARVGVPSQDQEHCPQHFRRQVLFLEPYTIITPAEGPHPAGVALEWSNAA